MYTLGSIKIKVFVHIPIIVGLGSGTTHTRTTSELDEAMDRLNGENDCVQLSLVNVLIICTSVGGSA